MMGTKDRNFSPLESVFLEELVPEDNFYCRLEEVLDLSFVRGLVEGCYASWGRPSVDPVVFKLQLVMFFEGLRNKGHIRATVLRGIARAPIGDAGILQQPGRLEAEVRSIHDL